MKNRFKYVTTVKVKLDGKYVGDILQMLNGGFAYFPKGNNGQGDTYPTLEACKRSLEED